MIVKKCRHGRGLTGPARTKAWRACRCAWIASVTVDGHRSYVNLGAEEAAAKATYHRITADNLEGRAVRTRPGKAFSAVADSYLAEISASPKARPNRVRTTTSRLERLKVYWEDNPVDGITVEHVRVFITDLQNLFAPNTAISLYSAFRSVIAHAQDHGLVDALPLPLKARIPKVNSRKGTHLTVPECLVVIDALHHPYRAMAGLSLLTGLRVGEVAALRWEDFDRHGEVLHVRGTLHHDGTVGPPKTHHGERVVALSRHAVKLLADHAEEAGARDVGHRVFDVPSLAMCGYVMRVALRATKLYRPGRGWHAFRHAHTAILEAGGVSVREAAARLGHGPNFVQTASYGWSAEAPGADSVDVTIERLTRHGGTSGKGRRRAQGSAPAAPRKPKRPTRPG